jgi:hypothetical protein
MNKKSIIVVCVMILSVASLLSSCDGGPSGKVDDAQGKDTQRNGAGTSSVDVSSESDAVISALTDGTSGSALNAHDAPDVSDEELLVVGDKMFVGQMNDIYLNPDSYMGRTIKYEGFFTWFDNEETGQRYNCVVRNGPGCCGYDSLVGFEVDWNGEMPKMDDWCSVQGTIDTYLEDGLDYVVIRADALEVLPYRGDDTVTQ